MEGKWDRNFSDLRRRQFVAQVSNLSNVYGGPSAIVKWLNKKIQFYRFFVVKMMQCKKMSENFFWLWWLTSKCSDNKSNVQNNIESKTNYRQRINHTLTLSNWCYTEKITSQILSIPSITNWPHWNKIFLSISLTLIAHFTKQTSHL